MWDRARAPKAVLFEVGCHQNGGWGVEENFKTPDAQATPQTKYVRISGIGTQVTGFLNAFQVIPTCSQVREPPASSTLDQGSRAVGACYVKKKVKTLI